MQKTNLLMCPVCKTQRGFPMPIGEVTDGVIKIRRHWKDYTIVGGKDLWLACGGCGEVVFKRDTHNVRIVGTVSHLQIGTP